MNNKTFLEYFPPEFVPRTIQKEILQNIESHVKSDVKTIILSAPTGVGKSQIAATLARYFGSSFVVTASKQLQDQYINDFKFLKPVKGKSNFPCLQLMEHEHIDKRDYQKAVKKELTCEKGHCKSTITKNGKKITEICKYKPTIEEIDNTDSNNLFCHYYKQKYEALVANHSLWNYSSYFQLMKYNKETFAQYINRPVGIFDEAHAIENQITNFMGIDIYAGNVEECNQDIKSYDLKDIELVLMLLENLTNSYRDQIEELKNSRAFNNNPDYIRLSKLESKYERYSKAFIDISVNKENFVIDDPKKDANGNFRSLSIKPLDISGYAQEFFDIPVRIFMSATVEKDGFCENMGFNPADVAFIDTLHSPFLSQNRRIHFLNITKLSKRKSTFDDEMKVIKKIDELLTQHANERGLILTSSQERCNDIKSNLSVQNKKRIRICHSINELGQTQNQILQEHANKNNSVLLSSSLWEGVDLKDELSRFQIIAKTPFPNLGDTRTRIKIKRFPLWYKSQTIIKLLQGFGRSIRNEKDWAVTYVLDSSAQELLDQWKSMVPKSFHDVIWPNDMPKT